MVFLREHDCEFTSGMQTTAPRTLVIGMKSAKEPKGFREAGEKGGRQHRDGLGEGGAGDEFEDICGED